MTERAEPGASQRPLLRRSRRGPQVRPSAAARDIALAASGGESSRGLRVFPPPPRSSVHPYAPPPQLPSLSSPRLPRPPRLCRLSGAARLQLTGLESRLRAPDSRPPALPLPPPPPAPSPPTPPSSPPPPPSSGAQAQPPPPQTPRSSAAAEHHGRRRERAQQSAQPAASLSLRLLGVSVRPGGGGGGGPGRGRGVARTGLGAAGGRNPGGWALAGPTGSGQGPRLGEGRWVGSWRWAEKALPGVHCHPLGLSCLRFGPTGTNLATGEGGRAAGRDEGVVLAPPGGAGVSLSLGSGGQPALPGLV